MTSVAEQLKDLERSRPRALVDADAPALDALHTADFVLVNPGGVAWSRERYGKAKAKQCLPNVRTLTS